MKTPLVGSLLGAVYFLGSLGGAHAQFYAPVTEYHDPVQRVFVVEAARVLAWWSNQGSENLSEITYDVTAKADQSTVWDIRWLDPTGKTVKTATISYPGELLKAGPDFYRSVFKQLWLADWKSPPALDPGETKEGFWRGAARMGLSREASLVSAFELCGPSSKKADRERIPELAGLLVHAALPGYACRVSMDRVVLARGAAWLAFAESLSSTKLDALWAPVLFQAGREREAARLWQGSVASKLEKATPEQEGWNLWLRKPVSREVFLFATGLTNLPMAMPMLTYDVMVNGTGGTLAELIGPLVGAEEALPELHNYAPLFATETDVGGGRITEGAWAMYARMDWMRLLSSYSPGTNEFRGYGAVLGDALKADPKRSAAEPDQDNSLIGFRECVPLLRLARTEGVGKLIPTPVATARDLLNYGWEMTGWQMGARYKFVNHRWGIHDLAEGIYKRVTTDVEGLMPFFKREAEANLSSYGDSLKRLQLAEGLFYLVGFSAPPMDGTGETKEAGRLFVKRCWLRPRDLEWQARALWDDNHISDIADLIRSMQAEGGGLTAANALGYLSSLKPDVLRQLPNGAELKYSVAETLPQPSAAKVRAIFDRKFKDVDNFTRAQEYERLYWQNPDSGLEQRVIFNYIVSGGYKSAQRFYKQARSNFQDPVKFSNGLGLDLFVLGYCLDSAELRAQALEDSRSGSSMDMMINIWDAAIRDRPEEIRKGADELVDRYEEDKGANSPGKRLVKFLPLLPALADPKHASRREALEYFGRDGGWTILRFIWIEKFKLPTEDAVVLLGGRENNALGQFLIAYLEKNQRRALDALNQLGVTPNARGEQKVLAACLYERIHPTTLHHEDSDLKPAGATSIRQAVLEKLKATGRLKE